MISKYVRRPVEATSVEKQFHVSTNLVLILLPYLVQHLLRDICVFETSKK